MTERPGLRKGAAALGLVALVIAFRRPA